jgi:hypothetical protein
MDWEQVRGGVGGRQRRTNSEDEAIKKRNSFEPILLDFFERVRMPVNVEKA